MFIGICVYMTMFICVCVYMTMFFCLSAERVSQLPHCYAWCHRGIRGADKTKQKSHHSPECCPCWAFNQKNLRSTNEEDGVGALLIRTDRNVKMQGPDWPNMRHWWPNNVRSTRSSTIVQRGSKHQTQLVLVCWKRTHICSNSDGGWDRSLLAPDMDHTLTTTCEIATFSVTFSILSFLKLFLQCW